MPKEREDSSLASWGVRVRRRCEELAAVPGLTRGELCIYQQDPAYAGHHAESQAALQTLLGQLLGSQGATGASAAAPAIKAYLEQLADKIDSALDQHHAQKLRDQGEHAQRGSVTTPQPKAYAAAPTASAAAPGPARPQDSFCPPVDNSNSPLVPDFSHLDGLAIVAASSAAAPTRLERHAAQLNPASVAKRGSARYSHPFAQALAELPAAYPRWQLMRPDPAAPRALADSELTFVDTVEGLSEMVAHLESVREVAIDLEHSDRSFQGFTCLMQISTRTRDFVIDALALRGALGAALAPVFSNPDVAKVLHGADYDVSWLQKDFGLFLVNMFDTGQAARILSLPCGLASLLTTFCGVSTDKRFQRADWRVRPLPEAMLAYARLDTHYLLYIADQLKARLLDAGDDVPASLDVPLPVHGPQGALGLCLERSRRLCQSLYEKPLFTDTDYLAVYKRAGVALAPEQLAVFAGLYSWRDRAARVADEASGHVLSRRDLVTVSQRMPASAAALLALVRKPSSVLATRVDEVVEAIHTARAHAASNAALAAEQAAALDATPSGVLAGDMRAASHSSTSDEETQGALENRRAEDGAAGLPIASTGFPDGEGVGAKRGAADHAASDEPTAPIEAWELVNAEESAVAADAPVEEVSFSAMRTRIVSAGPRPATCASTYNGTPSKPAPAASARFGPAVPATARKRASGGLFGPAKGAATGRRPTPSLGSATPGSPSQGTASLSFAMPIAGASLLPAHAQRGASSGSGSIAPGDAQAGVSAGPAGSDSATAGADEAAPNRAAEVRAAAAALRGDGAASDASGGASGACSPEAAGGPLPGPESAADGEHEAAPLSLRERHARKRARVADGEAAIEGGLLGDHTRIPVHVRGTMLQLPRHKLLSEEVKPFDYEAEVAARGGHQGRGRGGPGRGRAGRGRDDKDRDRNGRKLGLFEKRRNGGAYNPYALDERGAMRGGKRSRGNSRAGNKSGTFAG